MRYPVPSVGANLSSTTDFEQFTYDANGNVTSRRLRDAQTIGYTYDNLNRLTYTNLSDIGIDRDIARTWDLLSRNLSTYDNGGQFTTSTYDALGRALTTATTYGGTKTFQYDLASRMTRIQWPDGNYAQYDYDVTNAVTAIRENGAASGIGVLATYAYDNLGRRTGVTRGNGTTTSYAFDAVSRLTSLTQNLAGTANDVTIGTMAYNPSGQIGEPARKIAAYCFDFRLRSVMSTCSMGRN